jgi:hypothetical protein
LSPGIPVSIPGYPCLFRDTRAPAAGPPRRARRGGLWSRSRKGYVGGGPGRRRLACRARAVLRCLGTCRNVPPLARAARRRP